MVRARFSFVVIMQLLQMAIAVPFAVLRQSFNLPGNQVGMDANVAFFGFALIMLGIFNLTFFTCYYKNPDKVGVSFVKSSIAISVYMLIVETSAHIYPFVRDKLDTPDPQFLSNKLCVLLVGVIVYIALSAWAYLRSARLFEALDL